MKTPESLTDYLKLTDAQKMELAGFPSVPSNAILANGCELCGDQPEILRLHARCHLTAPLRAELEGETLTLFCYLPECNRKVAEFKLANKSVSLVADAGGHVG